jgi:hypothetical protein
MIFYAVIIQTQLHQGTFVVVRIAITQQLLVQFPPPDWRSKIQVMEMRTESLNNHTTCLEKFLISFYRYRWIRNAIYTCCQWFPYFTCQNWPYSSSDLVGCFVITIKTHQQMNEFSPLRRTLKTPVYKQRDNLVRFNVKSWSGTYIQLFQSDLPSQSCDHPCQPCCCCCCWNNTTQHNRVPNA